MAKKKQNDMNPIIVPVVIAILLAFPAGLIAGRTTAEDTDTDTAATTSEDTHSSGDSHSSDDGHSHDHEMFMVDAADSPAISNLQVTKDAKAGWNVSFDTANFAFAPENASSGHVDGEGHAHIYVDGKKVTRLYSGNYYLGELDEGEHTIRVTLNTNDHKDYAVDGAVVEASITVVDDHHDGEQDDHSHSHSN